MHSFCNYFWRTIWHLYFSLGHKGNYWLNSFHCWNSLELVTFIFNLPSVHKNYFLDPGSKNFCVQGIGSAFIATWHLHNFSESIKRIISYQYKDFRIITVYINGGGVFLIERNYPSVNSNSKAKIVQAICNNYCNFSTQKILCASLFITSEFAFVFFSFIQVFIACWLLGPWWLISFFLFCL